MNATGLLMQGVYGDLLSNWPYYLLGAFAAVACAIIMLLWWRQRRQSARWYKHWRSTVYRYVQDPIASSTPSTLESLRPELHQARAQATGLTPRQFEAVVFGDLFVESCISVKALTNCLDSYGVTKISDAWDLTSSPTAETIVRVAKLAERRLDGFGLPISETNIVPRLIPTSKLHQLSEYINNHPIYFGDNIRSFVGKVGETEIKSGLFEKGLPAYFAGEGQPGFDLYVPHELLESKLGISLPGGDTLQVKTVNSSSAVYRHFQHYPEIPVVAPDHVVDQLASFRYRERVIPFSMLDADYDTIVSTTKDHVKSIVTEQYGEAISQGLEIPELSEKADAVVDSRTRLLALVIAISTVVAIYRNYKLVRREKVTIPTALRNVATETAYAGGKATVGLAASALASLMVSKVATSMGVTGGTRELAADAVDGVRENLADGFDLRDIFDIGKEVLPFAIAAGAIVGAGYYARKGFDAAMAKVRRAAFRFQARKGRRLYTKLLEELRALSMYFEALPKGMRGYCEDNIYGPHYRNIEDRFGRARERYNYYEGQMSRSRKLRLFPPIEFFFVEHTKARLEAAMTTLNKQRGQIVQEYTAAKGREELGEFLFKYNDTVFRKIDDGHKSVVGAIDRTWRKLAAELNRLREKGIVE